MPNHARLVFSVPKPPSKQSTRDNPDETITWINKRLRELIESFKQTSGNTDSVLDLGAYMVIYSTIHQCTVTKDHGGELPGKRLYFELADIVRSHCRDLRKEILRTHPEAADQDLAVVEIYAREWKRHCKLAKLVAHNYHYMERHWVQHERCNGTPGVYPIQELHSMIWREEVAIGSSQAGQSMKATNDDPESILDIAVRLCKREGFNPEGELDLQASELLQEVFKSFEETGIRIGTWGATDEDRMLRPEIVAQHETLRSGLKITTRVPVVDTWRGRVR